MTASTVKSASVTNFDAVPVALSKSPKQGGKIRQYIETYEVTAATSTNEAGDIIKMIRVPSRLVPSKLVIFNDDLDTHSTPTLAVDVGLYRADTGVVIDADEFASAITTLQAANTAGVNVLCEAHDIADIGKTLWEIAGYSADPGISFDVALTVTTEAATGANGTITMVMEGALAN